jgi:hypothetical protein
MDCGNASTTCDTTDKPTRIFGKHITDPETTIAFQTCQLSAHMLMRAIGNHAQTTTKKHVNNACLVFNYVMLVLRFAWTSYSTCMTASPYARSFFTASWQRKSHHGGAAYATRTYIYIHTHMHVYIYTSIQKHIYTYIHMYMYTYIHTYIYVQIHTFIYIYTYIHTYI